MLSQIQSDRQERVIAYASHLLSKGERHYCITHKELLAVVVFLNHFRQYLLGRNFILQTDHGSLLWLHNLKEPEYQLARWLEKLEEFQFEVVHRKGKAHCNPDALSLMFSQQSSSVNVTCPATIAPVVLATALGGKFHQGIRNC